MAVGFCLEALAQARGLATPASFHSDQGAQFPSAAVTGRWETAGIKISLDGRGRALDKVFGERLWRTGKYEEGDVQDDGTRREAIQGLERFLPLDNRQRPHQALGSQTPATVYCGSYL